MKLATFKGPDGTPQIGALIDNDQSIALLQSGAQILEAGPSPHFASMLAFIRGGDAAKYKAHVLIDYITTQRPPGTILPLDLVTLLSPLPVPESIRDCMAFETHIINSIRKAGLGPLAKIDETIERFIGRKATLAYRLNQTWYRRPIYYKSNRFTVVGHGADIRMPSYTQWFDFELEWGVVIGMPGKNIPEQKARSHIAGYVIFNDFSARDMQLDEMRGRLGPTKGKDFDTGNAIGPWLVTPDEIPDPYDLTMIARVNGEEWARGSTADMYWSFERLIFYISRDETLYPGEFIGSGTCSGAGGGGCGLELGRDLKPGDVVELEVEKIGILRNRVVDGRPRLPKSRPQTSRATPL